MFDEEIPTSSRLLWDVRLMDNTLIKRVYSPVHTACTLRLSLPESLVAVCVCVCVRLLALVFLLVMG